MPANMENETVAKSLKEVNLYFKLMLRIIQFRDSSATWKRKYQIFKLALEKTKEDDILLLMNAE